MSNKNWLAKVISNFESASLVKKISTVTTASILSVSTVALTVPQSNVGQLLKAQVDAPPSFSIDLGDVDEDENAPPEFNADLGEGEAAQNENPPAPCVENSLQNNQTEACIGGEFVLCEDQNEGQTTTDESYICEDENWIPNTNQNPQPPAQEDEIEITDNSSDPEPFNPITQDVTIEFELSEDALIELTIENLNGEELIKILDDDQAKQGKNQVEWKGTHDNTSSGNVLPAGIYIYKITAKNVDTGATEDTEEDQITLIYQNVGTPDPDPQPQEEQGEVNNSPAPEEDQSLATQTMTNVTEGETSGTGPGVLIYSIFPLAGYLFTRKKHKQ